MNAITYTASGDFLIPNIRLTEIPEEAENLGRYGRMRKAFLKEHRTINYNRLLLTGKLFPHLQEIEQAATGRLERAMAELVKLNSLPDKEKEPMAWTSAMNTLRASAEEIVRAELIYS